MAAVLLLAAAPWAIGSEAGNAAKKEKKSFQVHTALEKGEKTVGLGVLFANFNSDNSEFLLLANNLGAKGNVFRIAPNFSVAYKDNASVGLRLKYSNAKLDLDEANLRLFSDALSAGLSDVTGNWKSFGGTVFHRNYIGLDPKGTVGLFCEFQLGYSYNRIDFGADQYNTANQVKLSFNPGLILYILPMVSVEASVGLADVSYTTSLSHNGSTEDGKFSRVGGGAHLNILNCNFGISFHF